MPLYYSALNPLADYLDADHGADDAIRLELTDLLGRIHAVRMLPSLDQEPDSEPHRVSIATQSDADEWNEN